MLGEIMSNTYPRQRLKVVPQDEGVDNEKYFRVEEILDHRKKGDDYEYLVK